MECIEPSQTADQWLALQHEGYAIGYFGAMNGLEAIRDECRALRAGVGRKVDLARRGAVIAANKAHAAEIARELASFRTWYAAMYGIDACRTYLRHLAAEYRQAIPYAVELDGDQLPLF